MTAEQLSDLRQRVRSQMETASAAPAGALAANGCQLRQLVAQAFRDRPVSCIRGQEPLADAQLAAILRS